MGTDGPQQYDSVDDLVEATAQPGEALPPVPDSAYPPDATPLSEPVADQRDYTWQVTNRGGAVTVEPGAESDGIPVEVITHAIGRALINLGTMLVAHREQDEDG